MRLVYSAYLLHIILHQLWSGLFSPNFRLTHVLPLRDQGEKQVEHRVLCACWFRHQDDETRVPAAILCSAPLHLHAVQRQRVIPTGGFFFEFFEFFFC